VARPTGLAFVEAEELSAAILDVNLRGEKLRFGGQAAGRRLLSSRQLGKNQLCCTSASLMSQIRQAI
jgi:hypothetical protein